MSIALEPQDARSLVEGAAISALGIGLIRLVDVLVVITGAAAD
jgi:hypothetical protein